MKMDEPWLPKNNLDVFLPGMGRDFKVYIDVLPPESPPRHPREDLVVRELAIHISNLIEKNT